MSFNPKDVIQLLEMVEELKTRLQLMPQLQPLVKEMLNGAPGRSMGVTVGATSRHISMARRKQMGVMMRKRWALAKKSGKTIGGKPIGKSR